MNVGDNQINRKEVGPTRYPQSSIVWHAPSVTGCVVGRMPNRAIRQTTTQLGGYAGCEELHEAPRGGLIRPEQGGLGRSTSMDHSHVVQG